jgi:hypothetical protein
MPPSEREQLMNGLRAALRGEHAGIDLEPGKQWVIWSIREPIPFFRALTRLLPAGGVLYMEGTEIAPYVAGFYERHAPTDTVPVVRDTISPEPDIFHVSFSPAVIDGLCELAGERESSELFDHIKGYHNGALVFTYHDAFDGQLRVAERVPESVIREFCELLGGTYTQEATQARDPEHRDLRRILWALENPDKVRILPEPIWKRVWRFITGR